MFSHNIGDQKMYLSVYVISNLTNSTSAVIDVAYHAR